MGLLLLAFSICLLVQKREEQEEEHCVISLLLFSNGSLALQLTS